MKTKKRSLIGLFTVLCCFLWAFAFGFTRAEAAEAIQIPTEAWEELKNNNASLATRLAEAELQINLLRTPSEQLTLQLAEAKAQLQQSQAALTLSNSKLENAAALQNETRKSLQKLTEQIEAERKQAKATQERIRRQRNFAYILLGIFAIAKL